MLTTEEAPTMAEKLSALSQILRHLPRQVEMTDEHFAYSIASMVVIMSPSATNYQRAACAAILDYTFPEWRDDLSLPAAGAVSDRNSLAARKWRSGVLSRDEYQCTKCGSVEELEDHHIVRWADNVFLRVEPTNGVTLCHACHMAAHGWLN